MSQDKDGNVIATKANHPQTVSRDLLNVSKSAPCSSQTPTTPNDGALPKHSSVKKKWHRRLLSMFAILICLLNTFFFSTSQLKTIQLSKNYNNNSTDDRILLQDDRIEESAKRLAPYLFNKSVPCRFDDVGRFLEQDSPIPSIVHKQLAAVPAHRRIPHSMANNKTFIVRGLTSFPDNPNYFDATNATLNDYNPTIFPLYRNGPNGELISDLDPKLLDGLTGRYHGGFSDDEADQVYYLAVTRSSNHYPACIPGEGFVKYKDKGYEWVNYPGLTLLDKYLEPIQGASVLIDIEKYFHDERHTRRFQDFTIFAARTTQNNTKKDQLFLMTNGVFILPIAIRRVPPNSSTRTDGDRNDDIVWETKIKRPRIPQDLLYGTGLQVKMTNGDSKGGHETFWERNPSALLVGGKNMHLFESMSGKTYLEIWPYHNHVVQEINFYRDSFTSFQDYSWENETFFSTPPKAELPTSEVLRMKKPPHRGTGCCADMILVDGTEVKIGIAHSVVKKGRTYLHRFYAFLPEEPFPVIGISGLFCLSQMQSSDARVADHWLFHRDNVFEPRKTSIGKETYDCPKITFASGITNLIGHDDNYIIISYGIDDCYSRSIIVHKKKIEMLLFGDLKSNVTCYS